MSDEVKTPPRKLVNLLPRWQVGPDGVRYLVFNCPCDAPPACECDNPECIFRTAPGCVFSFFRIPVTGPKAWTLKGDPDDFATLTLTPSIHAVGHWHGWLKAGVLESC